MRSSLADVLKFIQHTLACQGVLNLVRVTKWVMSMASHQVLQCWWRSIQGSIFYHSLHGICLSMILLSTQNHRVADFSGNRKRKKRGWIITLTIDAKHPDNWCIMANKFLAQFNKLLESKKLQMLQTCCRWSKHVAGQMLQSTKQCTSCISPDWWYRAITNLPSSLAKRFSKIFKLQPVVIKCRSFIAEPSFCWVDKASIP